VAVSGFVEELRELYLCGAPLIYVVTDEEERAVGLCRIALGRKGAGAVEPLVAVWSRTRGLDPIDPMARSPVAALDALLRGGDRPVVGLFLDFHLDLEERPVARRLRDLLPTFREQHRCLVVVAPRPQLPEGLVREATVLRLPLPGHDELAALLGAMMPKGATADAAARHAALIAATGLGHVQAQRAFGRALRIDPGLGAKAVRAVLEEKQRLLSRDRGLDLVEATERPEDLGGLDSFKAWIRERALAFAPDARRFGLVAPRGVMLLGVQGCGKSLAAKAVAGLLGVPLLRLDLPRVLGAGEGAEEGLARALEAAEAIAPVALWVDEIEKGFAGSTPGQGGDARAARLLGHFSTWLQERRSAVFVVATANDVTRLPPELLRRGRFDELFFVDLPDLEARQAILALHLAKRGRDPGKFDLSAVAEQCADYSGAELEQVVVGALHRAYALGRELETQDLRRLGQDLVPLYRTYEEQIKALREWARGRARTAGREAAVVDLFRKVGA
jgi:hypothetical protein